MAVGGLRTLGISSRAGTGVLVIEWDNVSEKPTSFPPAPHTHPQSDVVDLLTDLAAKESKIAPGTTSQYWRGDKSWQEFNKAAIGLSNVDNTSDVNKPISSPTQAVLDLKEDKANKGVANGYASLDFTAKIPSSQLPTSFSAVQEYNNLAAFPVLGATGVIYIARDTNKTYRWFGPGYVEISPSLAPASSDDVPEGSTNLYYTTARATLKADLSSPVFTGDPRAPTPALGDSDTSIATTSFVKAQGYLTTTAADLNYVDSVGDTMTGPLVLSGPPTLDLHASTKAYVDSSITGVLGVTHAYDFATATAAPPTSGTIRLNNVTQPSATTLWVHYTTSEGIDTKNYFVDRVKVGDTFYIQDRDEANKWQLYSLSGAYTDNGSYATMPVVWKAGGAPLTGQKIIISRETVSPAGTYLPLTGGTLTGPLVVPAGTTANTSLNFGTANTGFTGSSTQVDVNIGGTNSMSFGGSINVSTVPIKVPPSTAALTALNFGTNNTGIYGGSGTISFAISGVNTFQTVANGTTCFNKLFTTASTSVNAGITIPHGVAPTTPINGELWTTTAGVYAQINGATVGPLAPGGVPSLPLSGGTLTGPLVLPSTGTVSATSLNFGTAGTGAYGDSAAIYFSIGGTLRETIQATGIVSTVPFAAPNGSFGVPSYTFSSEVALGMYRSSAGVLGFCSGGLVTFTSSATALTSIFPVVVTHAGSAANTSLNFGTAGSGIYGDAGSVSIATSGTRKLFVDVSSTTFSTKIIIPASTTAAASLNVPHGTAPTSPVNGDIWTTSAGGLYAYINGATVGPFGAGGASPYGSNPAMDGTAAPGSSALYSRGDHVHPSDTTRLATSAYTAADVLAKLITVDGVGSGLDADLLDGQNGTFYAPLANPVFTGDPQAPTPATADNDTSIATTAFVKAQGYLTSAAATTAYVDVGGDTMTGQLVLPAATTALASMNIPYGVAPTAPVNGDFWATSASGLCFRLSGVTMVTMTLAGSQTVTGAKTFNARTIFPASTTAASSIKLIPGVNPTTPADGDLWMTATGFYAQANGATVGPIGTGGGGGAPVDSPVFTGDPQAPTPLTADNDTSIATTAFVKAQGYLTSATAATTYVDVGGDTMTGPLVMPATGSQSATVLNFGTNGTGLFGSSISVDISISGTAKCSFLGTYTSFTNTIRADNGTSGQPTYAFAGDTSSGFYRAASGDIRLVMGAGNCLQFLTSDKSVTFFGPAVLAADPTLALQAATKQYADTKLASSSYTAADVLAKLLTVDGVASGLDADLLDAQSGTYYLDRANHTGTQAQSTIVNLTTDLSAKEPTITAGTTAQYWRGDKSWQTLPVTNKITVASTAPGSPATNDVWIDTT